MTDDLIVGVNGKLKPRDDGGIHAYKVRRLLRLLDRPLETRSVGLESELAQCVLKNAFTSYIHR